MQTTEFIAHPGPELPNVERILEETADLVEVVAVAGPPAVLFVGPLVLLGLVLAGPFLAMLTIAVALVVAEAGLVALAGAVLAAPYLLVRRARA